MLSCRCHHLLRNKFSSNFTVVELLSRGQGATGDLQVLVLLQVANQDAHAIRGAPSTAEVMYTFSSHRGDGKLDVNVSLQWFNKTMTHVPETIWMSHTPSVTSLSGWTIDKIGSVPRSLFRLCGPTAILTAMFRAVFMAILTISHGCAYGDVCLLSLLNC